MFAFLPSSRIGSWADATDEGCEHYRLGQYSPPATTRLREAVSQSVHRGRLAGKFEWEAWVGAVVDPKLCQRDQLLAYIRCRSELAAAARPDDIDWHVSFLRSFPAKMVGAIVHASLTPTSTDGFWAALYTLACIIADRESCSTAAWSPAMCKLASLFLLNKMSLAAGLESGGHGSAAQRVHRLPNILHERFM